MAAIAMIPHLFPTLSLTMIIRFSPLVLQQKRECVCIFFVLSLGGVYVCCAGFALVVALTMGSVVLSGVDGGNSPP